MTFFDPSKFKLVAINIKYRSIPGFVSLVSLFRKGEKVSGPR